MEGFTKAMAIELAPHDIRVNTVGPTFLETPLTKPFFDNAAFKAEVLAKIKLGRLGKVEDVTGRHPVPRLGRLRPGDRHLARRRRRLDRRLRPPAPRATIPALSARRRFMLDQPQGRPAVIRLEHAPHQET